MGTERSMKPLHNFTLPSDLQWKNQRFLRCMKVNTGGQISARHLVDADNSDSSDQHRRSTRDREGARQRCKDLPKKGRLVDEDDDGTPSKSKVSASPPLPPPPSQAPPPEGDIQRPWNLRTRACRTPGIGFVATGAGSNGGGAKGATEAEQAKFSLSLSKREIEEDFFAITGHMPPRKPRKRPRNVQKQLDTLFRNILPTNVTPDMYEVPEPYS